MNYSTEQVVDGLMNYADSEVMSQLPVTGKWVMGTAIALASNKANHIIDNLKDNTIVKALDVVDENGNIDVDSLISAMKVSADKYGKITLEVPMVGRLSFTSADMDILRNYIH